METSAVLSIRRFSSAHIVDERAENDVHRRDGRRSVGRSGLVKKRARPPPPATLPSGGRQRQPPRSGVSNSKIGVCRDAGEEGAQQEAELVASGTPALPRGPGWLPCAHIRYYPQISSRTRRNLSEAPKNPVWRASGLGVQQFHDFSGRLCLVGELSERTEFSLPHRAESGHARHRPAGATREAPRPPDAPRRRVRPRRSGRWRR
jgi:hypothetical protein